MTDPLPAPAAPAAPVKKERGCLFFLAAAAGVFLLASLLVAVLVLRSMRSLLREYTGTAPIAIASEPVPAAESDELAERVKAFRDGVKNAPHGQTLELGEREINALIAREPELDGKVRVAVAGDVIRGQASLPLSGSGIPFVGGRYLNGEVAFKASLSDGVMIATIETFVLNDKPLPAALMDALKSENLAKDMYRRPKTAEILRKFESIQVKDGRLTLKLRPD